MSVDSTVCRSWSTRRHSPWLASWFIAMAGLRLLSRRKLSWGLLALASLDFLFLFATIYLKAQIAAQNPAIARFVNNVLTSVTGAGETYRQFMFAQGTATMLFLALVGEMLVGADFRQGGLTFYLSRRIGRRHYVVGKLLAVCLLVMTTTTLPALILYIEYGLLTDSLVYFQQNPRILLGILGYGALMAVTLSLLLLAVSSWIQKTAPLVMSWACLFALLPACAAILADVFGQEHWELLILWKDIWQLGGWCFGSERDASFVWPSVAVLGVCGLSAAATILRVRAVRVVG